MDAMDNDQNENVCGNLTDADPTSLKAALNCDPPNSTNSQLPPDQEMTDITYQHVDCLPQDLKNNEDSGDMLLEDTTGLKINEDSDDMLLEDTTIQNLTLDESTSSLDAIIISETDKTTSEPNANDDTKSEIKVTTANVDDKKTDKKKKDFAPPTKVVIRRLPPTMVSETFLEQVSPLPDYNNFYFVKADSSYNPYAFSRAYFNFVNPDDVYTFKDKFDNYVFLDPKGNEYFAVVEYAIFQRIPKKVRYGKRRDNKCGTIENDHGYIRFVEEFNQDTETIGESKPEYSFQIKDGGKKLNSVTLTPLIEFLNRRKQEQMRIREEKREDRRRREQARRRLKDEERRKKRSAASRESQRKDNLCQKHKDPKNVDVFDPYLCLSPAELQFESDGGDSGENSLTTYEELRRNSLCSEHNTVRRESESDRESNTKSRHNTSNRRGSVGNEGHKGRKSGRFADEEKRNKAIKNNKSARRGSFEAENSKPAFSYKNLDNGTDKCRSNDRRQGSYEDDRNVSKHRQDGDSESDKISPKSPYSGGRFDQKQPDSSRDSGRTRNKNSPVMKLRFPPSERGRKDIYANEDRCGNRFNKSSSNKSDSNRDGKKHFDNNSNTKVEQSPNETDWRQRQSENNNSTKQCDFTNFKSGENKSQSNKSKTSRDEELVVKSVLRKDLPGDKRDSDKKSEDGGSQSQNHNDNRNSEDDPRKQRRIRNKDRPALQIYRPGMGRFSKERKGNCNDSDQANSNDFGQNED